MINWGTKLMHPELAKAPVAARARGLDGTIYPKRLSSSPLP